jgi:exopolysaccharide biosynthesis polyprenyl glycosylphosphotransferase
VTVPSREIPAVADEALDIERARGRVRWQNVVAMLWVGDLLISFIASLLTLIVWQALPTDFIPTPFLPHWLVGSALVWLVALALLDGYDIVAPTFWRSALGLVFRALVLVLVVTGIAFFTIPFGFPRGVGLLAPLFASLALLVWRFVFARVARTTGLRRRVLLLGIDEASRRVAQVLLASRTGVSYEPVLFVTRADDSPSELIGLPVSRDAERLWTIVRELDVDEIVVGTDPSVTQTGQIALVECFSRGVAATSAIALYEGLTGRVLVSSLGPTWFDQIPTEAHRPYLLARRMFDVLAVLTVLPLAVLLGAAAALAVFVASGRPVLYRQVRVGERRRTFVIHKFRTMTTGAEPEGAQYAVASDPRVTSIGRLLRRTHLDELPQLWDVLRGNMSIIGPRPERPEFVERLRERMPLYEARFLLRPGLTGWAQVRLPYAANMEESLMKLEYDLYYVKHVSPQLDLSIIARTVGLLLRLAGR